MTPIAAWRLYRKLNPLWIQLERALSMKLSVNAIIQILAIIGQGAAVVSEVLPPQAQKWTVGTLAVVQALTGILAHFRNPDGTPAAVAYLPQK